MSARSKRAYERARAGFRFNKRRRPDIPARIVFLEAMLYLQVFDNTDKGGTLLAQIQTNYPSSKFAGQANIILAQITKHAAAKKNQSNLTPGTTFPDFNVKDLNGKPLSVAALKGKVVLIDFWATWCVPCLIELPNVIATYDKYHAQGFEIIGVSLDSDRDKLDAFLKNSTSMAWPQFFDGQGFDNALAAKYGVEAIPSTILIGTDGKIIKTNLSGKALGEAVANALAKK